MRTVIDLYTLPYQQDNLLDEKYGVQNKCGCLSCRLLSPMRKYIFLPIVRYTRSDTFGNR